MGGALQAQAAWLFVLTPHAGYGWCGDELQELVARAEEEYTDIERAWVGNNVGRRRMRQSRFPCTPQASQRWFLGRCVGGVEPHSFVTWIGLCVCDDRGPDRICGGESEPWAVIWYDMTERKTCD